MNSRLYKENLNLNETISKIHALTNCIISSLKPNYYSLKENYRLNDFIIHYLFKVNLFI